jgi:DNA-binding HxlR family transcriptional regulator
MDEKERYEHGMQVRRAVLGEAYVDRANANRTAFNEEFQELLTRHAWGDIWTRPGLSRHTRSLLVIAMLEQRPTARARFSELKRSIPGISQRMLTATLRSLERDGLLTRHVYAEVPPRVEYELTAFGRSLEPVLLGLRDWGDRYKRRLQRGA